VNGGWLHFVRDIMTGLACGALVLGGLVSLFNVYLSFVRLPLLKASGRPGRCASPLPGIGTILLLLIAAPQLERPWLVAAALVLGLIDTGGVPWWFAMSMIRARGRS
jgi:hypothetical protein